MTAQLAASRPASTLVRIAKQHNQRHVAFWNQAGDGCIQSDTGGGRICRPADWPLSRVLDLIARTPADRRVRVLFLVGGETVATEPARAWWREPAAKGWTFDGYEMAAASGLGGHFNAGQYTRDGVTVDVRMSARWFPGVSDPAVCVAAWNTLARRLRGPGAFDDHAALLATPAATGLDLLHRSLPRTLAGHAPLEWPAAPDALRDVLFSQVGQGRMQYCPDPARIGETIAGTWTLDGRWMYAACLSHLPVGVPHHTAWLHGEDAEAAYLPFVTAWYRVAAQVPTTWRHLGLIPERCDGMTAWPNEPGVWIPDAWVSGAELAVALEHRWPVIVYERWDYRDADHTPGHDPARTWINKLRLLRATSTPAAFGEHIADPMAAAIRHLVIDTVGMWHRQAGQRLRVTPPAEAAGPVHHLDRRANLAYWYERTPLSAEALAFSRPEWSATVWGRARARLHRAMLQLPRRDVLELRTDAIVLARPPELWPDDGQPGSFRVKDRAEGPLVIGDKGVRVE